MPIVKPKTPSFKSREEYEKWKTEKAKSNVKSQKLKERQKQFFYYHAMMVIMQLLYISTWVMIAIFLLPFVVPYIGDIRSYKYANTALDIEKAISTYIQSIIPTKIAGIDFTRWLFIIVVFFMGNRFKNLNGRYRFKIAQLKVRLEYEAMKKQLHLSDNAKILAPIKAKLEGRSFSGKVDREELLKLFSETKKKLDTMGRDVAFLSIDVVDSTGMKQGEEKAIIEQDFKEYKKFVEGRLSANGALKAAWTPDGVMICFPSVDTAVRTAREIIEGLDAFNKHTKTIKQDFKVRCGINSGYVYFDESMRMEEMSDRVIDIAGHMQKHASPNNICIAKPAIEPMRESEGFVPASKVVDGYEVYVWEKK